jgi:hypothetical protein
VESILGSAASRGPLTKSFFRRVNGLLPPIIPSGKRVGKQVLHGNGAFVILNEVKNLFIVQPRPFAALRVTCARLG